MRGHRDIILQEAIPKFQEYLPCNNEIIGNLILTCGNPADQIKSSRTVAR